MFYHSGSCEESKQMKYIVSDHSETARSLTQRKWEYVRHLWVRLVAEYAGLVVSIQCLSIWIF